jgi:hypothetical protein
MASERKRASGPEARSGVAQTAYKRQLAYEHLGIDPKHVECVPFFRANLKRIGRLLNHRGQPLDLVQASADPDACKVSRVYRSVPESYRRLLPPEAFCISAGVSPSRVLELMAAVAARQTCQASAVIAALWHPRVVAKTIQRALSDGGTRERGMLLNAMGSLRP